MSKSDYSFLIFVVFFAAQLASSEDPFAHGVLIFATVFTAIISIVDRYIERREASRVRELAK